MLKLHEKAGNDTEATMAEIGRRARAAARPLAIATAKRKHAALVAMASAILRNEQAILAHLSAVTEVANLLKNAIQQAEADGTYSAGEFGWAQP